MMRFLASILALCAIPAVGQTFTLGTSSDPCQGGNPFTIANSTSTVRWGDFVCTFPVAADGIYTLELDFLEPCAAAGACAAGQVNAPGRRVQNVYANDQPVLTQFDIFTAGATGSTPATRKLLVYSNAGKIVVRVQTVARSGVLAGAVISQPGISGGISAIANTDGNLVITQAGSTVTLNLAAGGAAIQGGNNNLTENNHLGVGFAESSVACPIDPAGVIDKLLAKRTLVATCVTTSAATDEPLGIVLSGRTIAGHVRVAQTGYAPCTFDTPPNVGDYVIGSANGMCHSAGVSRPARGTPIVGTVFAPVAASEYMVALALDPNAP